MTDPLNDVFRANVEAARRLRRLSQAELCERMGVHKTTYRMQIQNPRGIGVTLTTLARYADALGIDAAVLVTPGGVQRSRAMRLDRVA